MLDLIDPKATLTTMARTNIVPATTEELQDAAYEHQTYNLNADSASHSLNEVMWDSFRTTMEGAGLDSATLTGEYAVGQSSANLHPSPYLNGRIPGSEQEKAYHVIREAYKDNPNAVFVEFDELNKRAAEKARMVKLDFDRAMAFNLAESPRWETLKNQGLGAMTDPLMQISIGLTLPMSISAGLIRGAAIEGGVGLLSEAPIQALVYEWQKEVGNKYTFEDVSTALLLATFIPSVIGGAVGAFVKRSNPITGAGTRLDTELVEQNKFVGTSGSSFTPTMTGGDVAYFNGTVSPSVNGGNTLNDFTTELNGTTLTSDINALASDLQLESLDALNNGKIINAHGIPVNVFDPIEGTIDDLAGNPFVIEHIAYHARLDVDQQLLQEDLANAIASISRLGQQGIQVTTGHTISRTPVTYTLVGNGYAGQLTGEMIGEGVDFGSSTAINKAVTGSVNDLFMPRLQSLADINNGHRIEPPPAAARPVETALRLTEIQGNLVARFKKLAERVNTLKLKSQISNAASGAKLTAKLKLLDEETLTFVKAAVRELKEAEAAPAVVQRAAKTIDDLNTLAKSVLKSGDRKGKVRGLTEGETTRLAAARKAHADATVAMNEISFRRGMVVSTKKRRAQFKQYQKDIPKPLTKGAKKAHLEQVNKILDDITAIEKKQAEVEGKLKGHKAADEADRPRTKIIASNKAIEMIENIKRGKTPAELKPVIKELTRRVKAAQPAIRQMQQDLINAANKTTVTKTPLFNNKWWEYNPAKEIENLKVQLDGSAYAKNIAEAAGRIADDVEVPIMKPDGEVVTGTMADVRAAQLEIDEALDAIKVCSLGGGDAK